MPKLKREEDTPQMKAVREAFANAIIHSDVFLSGGVLRIDKYDDRLCLRNPGTLKLPIEQIYEGGTSRARNPRMQMIGYGENLGSGFPLILTAWKDAGWGKPVLKNKVEIDEVEQELPIKKLIENPKKINEENKGDLSDVLKNVLKDDLKNVLKELSERQLLILYYIKGNDRITIQQMSQKVKLSEKTVRREVEILKEKGVLLREGGRKEGRWVIVTK